MIFLLVLSDFFYSLIVLASYYYPYMSMHLIYRFGFYFCSYFSIYWAFAIAFLVYKTLTGTNNIPIQRLFIRTLLVVVAFTLLCAYLMYGQIKKLQLSSILIHASLICGVLLALIFYLKSIRFLKSQSQFQQGPINLFIKNLQYYCLTQFVLYLPSIIFILTISGFIREFDENSVEIPFSIFAEGLASLAGFVNSIIFLKQGNVKEYQTPANEQLLDSSYGSLNYSLQECSFDQMA